VRLASKIFLASSLVIAVLVAVGALSLKAVADLVAVNREIAARAVPAVRVAAAARDGTLALVRLEARFLVLGDEQFAALWAERAARAREDLERLQTLLRTPAESALLRDVAGAFERYQGIVAEEFALVRARRKDAALRLAEGDGRAQAERVERLLESLIDTIHAGTVSAQAAAARLEARTWDNVLIALGAAVALGLAGTAFIANRATRSLRVLSRAAESVGAGVFAEPVRVRGRDEIAALTRAFNAMAARLRQVDELKQTFLATVTHELRSPLTSIREAAHLLREQVPGELNPKQARLVAIVEASSERLLRLVNQILDLSRLRAGMVSMVRTRTDVARVAVRAIEELRPQAEEAGVAIALEQVGARFDVIGDEDRLIQVAVNLLGNAVRFTPRGGRVAARVIDAGPEVELQVEDTGVGIPPAALPHIFEWYGQALHERGGTGLGLAIVRSIVMAHGGRVTVESHEGKGSRFTVLLRRQGAEG
jgi:signal transduction histidine kinase